MARFKKFDNQQVFQLVSKTVAEFEVGDLISYNADPDSQAVTLVDTYEKAKTAMSTGLELYIIAQSDAITYKTGTGYKSAKLGDETVNLDGAEHNIVVAYRVENLSNIEGLEA
jgi:hypothetical protein